MEDKENLRTMVEANLRSVTQSCKGGVPLDRLERDYRDLLGTPIPYRDMGYSSLEAMIRSMPDVIRLSRNNMGQLVAMGMADSSTAHIASLVARQRDSRPKKQTFHRPSRMQVSRGPVRQRPPLFAKRIYMHPMSKPPLLPTPVFRSSRNAPSSTAKPSHVEPGRWTPPPKKEIIPKTYEVPPRFLRAQKPEPPPEMHARKTPSPAWDDEIVPPPVNVVKPPVVRQKPDNLCYASGDSITVQTIPQPKPRSVKPKRTVCLSPPALPIPITAKEFVEQYAAMNNTVPAYRTTKIGQKQKRYISTLSLDGKTYKTYPDDGRTIEEAEEMAAAKAREAIESGAFETKLTETKVDTVDGVLQLVSRIEQIVLEKPNGIWSIGVPQEYETKHSESLPKVWLDLMKQHASNTIEFTVPERIEPPKGACILRYLGNPSGTTTPTSTSSHTSFIHEDDGTLDSNQKAFRMAFQGVPRLILPSKKEWAVLVTSVSSTVDIAVNLIDHVSQFATFCEEMAAFYEMQNTSALRIQKKKLYVARVTDEDHNYYHRVRVEEESSGDQVTCYFVDRGDTEQLKLSQLFELAPAFENCAFQAVHLQLYGLEDYADVITCDHLIKYLLDKTFIAKIADSQENKPVAILYDTSGDDDVNLNDLLRDVVICNSLKAELPQVGSTTMAYLTHVTYEGDIFLRPCNPYFHVLEHELEKLTPVFECSGSNSLLLNAKPDTMYAAKYTDNMWYRAMTTSSTEVTSDEVEVVYVDYGNTAWVTLSTICELEPLSKFLSSLPIQAMHCTLSEVPSASYWTEEAARKLCELVPDGEELIVKVEHPGTDTEPPKVTLFKRNEDSLIISINQTLAFNKDLFLAENMQRPPVSLTKPSTLPLPEHKLSHSSLLSSYIPDVAVPAAEVEVQKRQNSEIKPSQTLVWTPTPDAGSDLDGATNSILPPQNIPDCGFFDVYVTLAASPSNFVVQPMETAKQLSDLQTMMQQFYSVEDNIIDLPSEFLRKDNLYAALHSDGMWYRVRLKEIQDDHAVACVHFIDYGDYGTVSISNLQQLYKRFQNLPAQAIKASLAGIRPHAKDWTPDESFFFMEHVKERSFVSNIIRKSCTLEPDPDFNSMQLHLELIDTSDPSTDTYVHKELIAKGKALPC